VRTIRSGQNERYERRTGPYIRASSDWRGRASSLGSRGEACPARSSTRRDTDATV